MIIIINDNKIRSGKTSFAREILKGKSYLELINANVFKGKFWSFDIIPDWIFIDDASQSDIDLVNFIQQFEEVTMDIKNSNPITFKTPNFILITNQELEIKTIKNK